jgi:hypothetical protein
MQTFASTHVPELDGLPGIEILPVLLPSTYLQPSAHCLLLTSYAQADSFVVKFLMPYLTGGTSGSTVRTLFFEGGPK